MAMYLNQVPDGAQNGCGFTWVMNAFEISGSVACTLLSAMCMCVYIIYYVPLATIIN